MLSQAPGHITPFTNTLNRSSKAVRLLALLLQLEGGSRAPLLLVSSLNDQLMPICSGTNIGL